MTDSTPQTQTQATLLDGKATAATILDRCAQRVSQITKASGKTPKLATVLVGADPASATYVRMKQRRCEKVGLGSVAVDLAESTTTEQLIEEIHNLNANDDVYGILLQHPVPGHVDERAAFEAIAPEKDVDGVTIHSFGGISFGLPGVYGSCTPAGIMRLLEVYGLPLEGKHAVVVGRSPILGKPMAMMLLAANATVTMCHSRTRDLAGLVSQADIVVAAVGRAEFVRGEWVKPGAVVIDAGYTQGNVGDVEFAAAAQRASHITPVPGGVGPMTIAMLIEHTVDAAAKGLGVAV